MNDDQEHNYLEALAIIMNRGTMLLPERRHLVAMYKHIYDLEHALEHVREKMEHLQKKMHEDLKELIGVS